VIGGRALQIVPRLQKLLLMLSSERDGEVVNAARAIGRALQTVGADWNDLAGHLSLAEPQTKRPRDDSAWRVMRRFCGSRDALLSAREKEFVADLKHWRGKLTEKQHAWLTAIYQRLRDEAA
jgi:hypothetical protein